MSTSEKTTIYERLKYLRLMKPRYLQASRKDKWLAAGRHGNGNCT